jgi:EmrB/QacA subfamily drug resistance transporter
MAGSVGVTELQAANDQAQEQTRVDRAGAGIGARRWAALAVLCLGAFLVVLDTTIVNIAIPNIISSLHSSLDQVLWVLNGYTLVYAALLISGGRLGDLFGPRRLLLLGVTIFVIASIACSMSQSASELIAARLVQGVGGGLLTPQTLAMIPAIFPERRRGAAIGLWSGAAGLAAAVGPTLGGVLVTNAGWRSIFVVNVPLAALAIAGAYLLLPAASPGRRHRLDLGGILLATSGLFAIVFALVEGERYGWGTITGPQTIPGMAAAGILLLIVFVFWERQQPEPLLPLRLFSNPNFAVSGAVIAVFQVVMLTFIITASLYFQTARHMSPLAAGISLVPAPLAVMLAGPIAGRLSDRIHPKFILMIGLLLGAAGLSWVIGSASTNAGTRTFIVPLLVTGSGLGCGFAVVMTLGMRGIPGQLAGAASGVLNTFRQVGGAMGGAIAAALLQHQLASTPMVDVGAASAAYADTFVSALRSTLAVPVVLLLIAALSCVWIRRKAVQT